MKQKITSLLLSAIFVLSLLSGCGAKSAASAICEDKTILSKLKNDGSPEFVLEGNYYTLPMQVSELTQNGWTFESTLYPDKDIILQSGERDSVVFKKDGHLLSAEIVNNGSEPSAPNDFCQIIEITASERLEEADPDFFVTEQGIGLATSASVMEDALKDMDGYKKSSDFLYITKEGDGTSLDILVASVTKGSSMIKLTAANIFSYTAYAPQEEKEQEASEKIAEYKANAEKDIQPYANDYNALLTEIETNMTCGFYSQGTVTGKIEGYYKHLAGTALQTDISLYTVTDASGQVYCIYEGVIGTENAYLDIPELAEGDQISLWGFAGNVLETGDGSKIPVVVPKIIEKDRTSFYLDEEYQVK